MADQSINQTAQTAEVPVDTNSVLQYQDKKVVINKAPLKGQNVAVYVRPGDDVLYEMEDIDVESLEYRLVGGDIVVTMPNGGVFTFVSMALMGYGENPPSFLGTGAQKFTLSDVLSQVEEVNDLPFDSIAVEADIQQEDRVKKIVEEYEEEVQKLSQAILQQDNFNDLLPSTNAQVQNQQFAFEDSSTKLDDFAFQEPTPTVVESSTPNEFSNQFLGRYTQPPRPRNDFDAYKPDVEMIPKPDVEMIPKPDEEMMPENDFTDYFPENDFTDYFPENDFTDYGDGNGDGNGPPDAAKPAFYFKATAHQVRYSETTNDEGQIEILGGGGSINGYKFDSITNQFEPETIDISDRSEDMVIRAEDSTYFSDTPPSFTDVNTLTFKDLLAGQSVTVDGLKLTATDAITAADVATAFASLSASAATGNAVANGSWDGALSADWASGAATGTEVTFTSVTPNVEVADIVTTSLGSTVAAPTDVSTVATQGGAGTETHALTFQDLIVGQSVTVDGLKLTATGALTAAEVAAGFATLAASVANGNAVANGDWSGALSADWASGVATGAEVIFTSQTATTDVADIVVSSTGSTVDAPADVGVTSSQEVVTTYLSRVLRFEPQMPEGFYVESFILDGLPSGVILFDKDGNEISGSTITKDQMLFKDELGNTIDYSSPDFITNFKSVEFVIKYTQTLDPFNVAITSNYKLDDAYLQTTDLEPEQSYTNEYTFALKDITVADDYTYNKADFANAKDEGFILSKEPNYNIIKDGSGNSTIYGGMVKDIVYDGAGDDTVYLSGGDDTLYGGSGTNYIYGDTDNDSADAKEYTGEDTVSYENVQSFGSSEVKLLAQEGFISAEENQKLSATYELSDENGNPIANSLDIDMLASYKGVYVDLDGVHVDGLNIDVNGDEVIDTNDKINAISKFANRVEKFTYDENGSAIDTIIGENITFTSVTPNAAVEDITVSWAGVLEVAAPDALDVASTQGVSGTQTEEHALTFQDLIAGQSVTVDGLKLTAIGNITAAEVAAGFANLDSSAATTGAVVANGTWSGAKTTAWSSGAITDTATVTFTSQTPTEPVADIVISSSGVSAVAAPTDAVSSAVQGSDMITEKHSVVFKDLIAGQSVSIGGLTLTASTTLSAANIAAAFANLAAGVTEGNAVAGGEWSGTFSSDWTSGAQEQSGLENLQAIGYDVLKDIENITGSNYNDTIYGNALKDNVLSGLDGSDTIDGRGGNNTLLGGDGYDTLFAGSGEDFIDGGADTDTVSYINATQGMIIRFDRPFSEEFDYAGYAAGDFVIKDKIINMEDIRGSEYADTIYGNGSTNFIEAGDGDDRIFAGGGYDFIDGGTGSDWISYNPADYPNLATNSSFMEEIQGITVDLNSSDFVMVKETTTKRLIDLVKDIEQIRATNGNDVIYGGNSAETFWGLDGDDRLESRGGNDILYGGDGNDYLRPGAGLDISYGGAGTDYLELYNDGLVAGSRLRLSEAGTLQYSTDSTDGVDGTWADGYNANGGINLAYEFEGFGGSTSADVIYGNNQDNVLNGHQGDDKIYGLDGADTIRGGDGADTIYGGDGDDIIYGERDDDIIDAGSGDDTVYGYGKYTTSSNNDTIDGGTGTNTLDYTATNDGFVLNMMVVEGADYSRVDFSTGAIYDDLVKNFTKIIGSRGADTITANDSGMYLDGWSGVDKLYGGAGSDTIIARNTTGEVLDGGTGADLLLEADTLQLAQNVNLRNITLSNFEILDLQSYNGYLNLSQLGSNSFQTIKGSGNFYLYGTSSDDNLDFGTIDFSGFSGNMYVYGYGGDDIYNFENATLGTDATFYLDASSGTDTLKLGANQTLNMTDNYYNTFEKFDIGADSTLNVNALNNNGRSFYAHNKDFDNISADDGLINFIGGSGDDIFYVDYTALEAGKLSIDGKGGADRVDIRAFTGDVDFTNVGDSNLFSNIETLDIDQAGSYDVNLSADVLAAWIDGSNLTLDIANNAQGSKITITGAEGGDITNLTLGSSYSIVSADDPSLSFTMAVV
ncbi:MAG: calcium-binding protein [Sulfurimonas sp.]